MNRVFTKNIIIEDQIKIKDIIYFFNSMQDNTKKMRSVHLKILLLIGTTSLLLLLFKLALKLMRKGVTVHNKCIDR